MYWSYHILLNSSIEDSYETTILCTVSPIPILAFVLFSAEKATVEVSSFNYIKITKYSNMFQLGCKYFKNPTQHSEEH